MSVIQRHAEHHRPQAIDAATARYNSTRIKALLKQALTDRIDDREIFMKGIDYSYYYEQEN